jgi:hypothetical protein
MTYEDRVKKIGWDWRGPLLIDSREATKIAAEADAEIDRLKQWRHYPIDMPLTAEGMGPATIGFDAASVIYEVWDENCTSYGAFPQLRQAIELAMRLNSLPENP